jgi:AcrR family transcriptional regulator
VYIIRHRIKFSSNFCYSDQYEKKTKESRVKATKGDKRQRTRSRLIDAATEVIREKGYDKTTLEEVARRAGMTRGAIYNNFQDKEDLYLAVIETRWEPIVPQFKPGATFKAQMHILGEAVVAAASARRSQAVGALSFQLYALTHEAMRARMVKTDAEIYRWAAEELVQFIPARELPLPPEEFVKVLHALTDGLLALKYLTPELITDELIIAAFESLA